MIHHHIRILDIQIELPSPNFFNGHFPGLFGFYPVFPPLFLWTKFLDINGLRPVITFYTIRIRVFIVPGFSSRRAFIKEEQVGFDAGIGIEHAVREADNGV